MNANPDKVPSKRSRRRSRKSSVNPSANVQVYRGPLFLAGSQQQDRRVTVQLVQVLAFTTSGGGVLNTVLSLALNQFNEYTNYAALYDENRLLGCTFEYVPNFENSTNPSVVNSVCVVCLDRDSNAALTTLSGGYQYESARVFASNKRIRLTYRMSGSEDAQFASTSSTSQGFFKLYGASLSNTTTYGYFFIRALFQLRGRL